MMTYEELLVALIRELYTIKNGKLVRLLDLDTIKSFDDFKDFIKNFAFILVPREPASLDVRDMRLNVYEFFKSYYKHEDECDDFVMMLYFYVAFERYAPLHKFYPEFAVKPRELILKDLYNKYCELREMNK